MTTKEKIENKVRKHKKGNIISKYVGLIGMSVIFGFLFLFWQSVNYEIINNRSDGYVWVQDTTKSVVIQKMNIVSENTAQWIYSQYTYLDSVNETLSIFALFGSSFLFSALIIFIFFVPMFGTNDRWYYDEFTLNFTINGKSNVNGKDSYTVIKELRINKLEDIGDKYKINATTYNLTGVPGNDNFEIEKYKVTEKAKKWIWF